MMQDDKNADRRKLWKGSKKNVRLGLSIYGRTSTMHIYKDVLRVIGAPTHICFKVNQEMDSFIVIPCEAKETLSFKVPDNIMLDNRRQMTVTSQSFVLGLLSVNNLDFNKSYNISGIYSEKNNAVVFNMSDIKPMRNNKNKENDKR